MGDVVSLVERAASLSNAAEMETIGRRMMENTFDLNDFLKQSEMMAQMGSMAAMAKMLPGVAGRITDAQAAAAESRLRVFKSLIQSMTLMERLQPQLLKDSKGRAERVARGAGRTIADVGQLLSTYGMMRDQMAQLSKMVKGGGGPPGMAGSGAGGMPSAAQMNAAQMAALGGAGAAAAQGRKGKADSWREAQVAKKKGGGGGGGGGFGGGGAAVAPAKKGFGKK
jgi:signal recognition particle subunit SRP54